MPYDRVEISRLRNMMLVYWLLDVNLNLEVALKQQCLSLGNLQCPI